MAQYPQGRTGVYEHDSYKVKAAALPGLLVYKVSLQRSRVAMQSVLAVNLQPHNLRKAQLPVTSGTYIYVF